MTSLLRQDEAYLHAQTEALLEEAKRGSGYDCGVLNASPLRARAIRMLLTIPKPAMCHVQAVEELIGEAAGSKEVHLPSMTVRREYKIVYFGVQDAGEAPVAAKVSRKEPGSILWGSWKITWQAGDGCLEIRTRRTGDSIKLPGGTRSIKKLLIDRKVPANIRDTLPVVICDGEVVAVADLAANVGWISIEERKT